MGLDQHNPSFTIPLPQRENGNNHKESWFGSFGASGRKSTENILPAGRTSFSLGQDPSSSATQNMASNSILGASGSLNHHKYSLTGSYLNSNDRLNSKKNPAFLKNDP